MSKDDKKDLYKDLEQEFNAIQKEMSAIRVENDRLKEVIIDNELEEELDFDCTSIQETICINGIHIVAKLVEEHNFTKADVECFEKFFNILRTIRGKSTASKKKVGTKDVGKLLEIVKKGN